MTILNGMSDLFDDESVRSGLVNNCAQHNLCCRHGLQIERGGLPAFALPDLQNVKFYTRSMINLS